MRTISVMDLTILQVVMIRKVRGHALVKPGTTCEGIRKKICNAMVSTSIKPQMFVTFLQIYSLKYVLLTN